MATLPNLTEDTNPGTDSLIYMVDDPGGSPVDRKVTLNNLLKNPGPIGSGTRGTGAFTTLAANGAVTFTSTLSAGATTVTGTLTASVATGSNLAQVSTGNSGTVEYRLQNSLGSWAAFIDSTNTYTIRDRNAGVNVFSATSAGVTVTGTGTFSSYLQGTLGNGWLDLRGDSAATKGLRLNDAGNLGFTTDIELWDASYSAIEFFDSAVMAGSGGGGSGMFVLDNAYFDGGWKRKTANLASSVVLDNGVIQLRQAVTGSINSAITWVTSAQLDASGNLLLGATSTSSNAQFYATKTYSNTTANDRAHYVLSIQSVATTAGLTASRAEVRATHTTGTVGYVIGALNQGIASGAGGTTAILYGTYSNVRVDNATAVATTAISHYIENKTRTGTIGTGWAIKSDDTDASHLAGAIGVGTLTVAPAWVNAGASTTARASLNIPSGTAPTSPTNGDIWSDGSDILVRLGGTTYTLQKA